MERLVVLTHALSLFLGRFSTLFPVIFRFYLQTSSQSIISISLILLCFTKASALSSAHPCYSFLFFGRMYAGKNDGLKPKMGNESSKVVKRETPADYDVKNGLLEEDKTKIGVDCGGGGSGKKGSSAMRCCQAEKCSADLSDATHYHWRHKVCEYHAKAEAVLVGGIRQRFCQQCSRFHELAEFDDMKRSCRRRLGGHNKRRRKNCESQSEGSSRKGSSTRLKDTVCGLADNRGRIQKTIQESATYKHFQIRLR